MRNDSPQPARQWLAFAALVGLSIVGVALFFLIRSYGEILTAPAPTEGSAGSIGSTSGKGHALFHVLLALVAVIALGRALGKAFTFIGQPPVIGEVVAGIALGPSLLGRLSPD